MTFEKVKAVFDDRGRRSLVATGEPDQQFDCDEVLVAVGQENAFPWIERDCGIEFDDSGMQVAVFSAKPYDIRFLKERNTAHRHHLRFFDARLEADTAQLARGFPAICAFVNDQLDRPTLTALAAGGTRVAALRCTGFNNVDLHAAAELGITVARVPAYSPHARGGPGEPLWRGRQFRLLLSLRRYAAREQWQEER